MAEPTRVLHVDDEPDFAALTATFLEREDGRFDVVTAMDVDEGLDRLDDDVDCIVSDYDMPGRDGVEFLEAVRETYPDLPFILFTGKGSEDVASDAIAAGVTDYMQKRTGTDQYAVLANRIDNGIQQYRATREVEETNRRLRELTENAVDCFWMFDREWEELLFVSGYEAVWNRPESAIRENPRDFLEGVHPDDRTAARRAMDRLSGGESVDFEFRIDGGDSDVGWAWVKGEPILEGGEVVRVVGFTRDITERKAHERTLERQNERRTEFTRIVSHDLRNPLQVAQGRLELAREECDDPNLEDVARAHGRMRSLIHDLLTLARDGEVITDTEAVDPGSIAEDCWRTIDAAGATLRTETKRVIRADRSRLRQLLDNLLRNALEHGSTSLRSQAPEDAILHGGDDVTITVGDRDGDGFYVEDDGPGIPQNERERVLEPSHSTAPDETGFGLSIVREIATAHGWEIDVTESEAGGVRFEIAGVEVVR